MRPLLAVATLLWAADLHAAAPLHRFHVVAGAGAAELLVEAQIAPGNDGNLCVREGYEAFVTELTLGPHGKTHPGVFERYCVKAQECEASGCEVRYRFQLAEAARKRRDRTRAFEHEGALLSPPGTWLLSPTRPRPGSRYRLVVETPPGIVFVNGALPARDKPAEYEGQTEDLMDGPYAGFGAFETARVDTTKGIIDVAITPGDRSISTSSILDWVRSAAANVSGYLGRYPMPRALVVVLVGGRRGVGFGSTMGFGGGSVMISIGRDCAEADLKSDWTLTHEMVHLALPNLSRRQHWMEEGMSTYVEPVARTRTGVQPPEAFWSEMIGKLPNGVSAVSGTGLDEGGGWAGTYWGGALYWFMADVAIRERTGNRKGLEDALRGIMSEGTIADSWPVERVLRAGDNATSTTVLTELYERLGRNACTVDLQDYWKRLGVERHGDTIVFDDKAPLAAIRKAIVTPRT